MADFVSPHLYLVPLLGWPIRISQRFWRQKTIASNYHPALFAWSWV